MIDTHRQASRTGRILIYRNGAIGDTVLTAPVVAAMRKAFPVNRVILIGHRDRCRVLVRDGLAHEAVSAEDLPLHRLYVGGDVKTALKHLAEDVDIVLWYGGDPQGKLSAALHGIAPQVWVHPPEPEPDTHRHIIDHLLDPLERIGVPISERRVCLPVSESERERGREILKSLDVHHKPVVILAPGASRADKRWPVERYAQLAIQLNGLFLTPPVWVVLTGPNEWELGRQLCHRLENFHLDASRSLQVHMLPELELADLAAVISCSSMYIGNDSGPTHLAAGMGIPTVSIFMHTDPRMWSPRGINAVWEWGVGDDPLAALTAKCQFVLEAWNEEPLV